MEKISNVSIEAASSKPAELRKMQSPSPARHGRGVLTPLLHSAAGRRRSRPSNNLGRVPKPRTKPSKTAAVAESAAAVYMRSTIHKISTILRSSPWSDAVAALRALPVRWDSFTVNRVLKTHPPMEKAWLFFNWAAALHRFKHDRFTYTTMLDIFGEAGRIASMWHVFREMEARGIAPDVATFTSIAHWLAKDGDLAGAAEAWEEMRTRGCRPTVVSYTAFMKVLLDHGRPKEAAGVYREMLEFGLSPNCHTYTVLMEYLAGTGKVKAALEVMNKMQEAGVEPDKATCNILIEKFSKAGETSAMRRILIYMKDRGIVLRRLVFLEALEALKGKNESDDLLREVNRHLSYEGLEDRLNFKPTSADPASLIDGEIIVNLLARRNFVAIENMMHEMSHKDAELDGDLISAVIEDSCANCRPSSAMTAFSYGSKTKKELSKSAYTSLFGFFIRANSFQVVIEIVQKMIKDNSPIEVYLASVLIYRLGRAGFCTSAASIFYSLPMAQNIFTCTALMDALFQAGKVDKGLELYSYMRRQGLPITSGTYEVLILGLEGSGRISDAEIFRKEKKKFLWSENIKEKRPTLDESLCNCLFGN